jgi:Activator of Hsp90 ATPase homolog 1-like protein
MNERANPDAYGVLSEPATLTIQRMLPGPIERVWAYLTESDLRRKWLASGEMEMKVGAPFEFVWRNSELTDPPGKRPEGFGEEHRARSAAQARIHLGKGGQRRLAHARAERPEGAAHRRPPPPAHAGHDGRRQHRLARAPRHAGRAPERREDGALLGPVHASQGRIRPAHSGLTNAERDQQQEVNHAPSSRFA